MSGVDGTPVELQPGARLAHYEIQSKLGAGGMGWVYQALDRKLNRLVAIKIMSRIEFGGEDAQRRFAREAQAISALNHPNIVTIYEVGQEHGHEYIAMERVEGRTLDAITPSQGLELREALGYAVQMASALAVAHEAGIVHRDLKPGNVMVTGRGLVKVLDFGLAKFTSKVMAAATEAATATISMTAPGVVLGTAAYMSPEQAEGQGVDARSDIFSFGCVLYKMLTGTQAYQGASYASTIASVLTYDPAPLRQLKPGVPPSLEQIVRKCLQKKAANRWQNMTDVKLLLEDALRDVESGIATAPTAALPARTRRMPWLLWSLLLAFGGVLATGSLLFFRRPPDPALAQTTTMLTADTGLSGYPALSKDGSLVAFASDRAGEGNLDIWIQQIGGREPIRLTRDEADESDPSISPDGTKVAFRSEKNGGGIYVIPAFGGEPTLVAPGGRNPQFSPDGRTIAYWAGRSSAGFVPGSASVYLVPAGGGPARPVSTAMAVATNPVWAPQGDTLLVLGRKDSSGAIKDSLDWWILSSSGGAPKRTGVLARLNAEKLRYAGTASFEPIEWLSNAELEGRRRGSRVLLAAARGDGGNLWEIGLTPAGVSDGSLRRITIGPGRQIQASEVVINGVPRIVYADLALNLDIWGVPIEADTGVPRGGPAPVIDSLAAERSPSLSSDGKRMAYLRSQAGNWSMRLMNLATQKQEILVNSDSPIGIPKLSGDGSRIAYCDDSQRIGFSLPSEGGSPERLFEGCGAVMDFDGRRILYEPLEDENLTMFDTALRKNVVLARHPAGTVLSGSRFSPDGKWVAFHSIYPSSKTRIWVVRIDGALPVPESDWIPITSGEAIERDPAWAPGGGLLYYLSEADGFRCIWARRLDSTSKKPVGEPFAVEHFHSVRRSMAWYGTEGLKIGLSVAPGRMVFSMTDLKGNLWLQEAAR